jgi:hypothetical protein
VKAEAAVTILIAEGNLFLKIKVVWKYQPK